MSFKPVLLLSILTPFLLFCGFFIVFTWQKDLREAQLNYERLLSQNVRLQRNKIESAFEQIRLLTSNSKGMLGYRLHKKDLEGLSKEDLFDSIEDALSRFPQIAALGIALEPGWQGPGSERIFLYVLRELNGDRLAKRLDFSSMDYVHEEWFEYPMRTGEERWVAPDYYAGIENWAITYSMPMTLDGERLGVLCVDTLIEEYAHELAASTTELGEGAFCAVIGSDGTYYIHENPDYVRSKVNMHLTDITDTFPSDQNEPPKTDNRTHITVSRVKTRYAGPDTWLYMVQAPISLNDWSLAVFLPEDNFLVPLYHDLLVVLAIVVTGMAITAGALVLCLHYLSIPFKDVVGVARRIGKGDMSRVVSVSRFKEFTILADTFNQMIDALAQRSRAMRESIDALDEVLRAVAHSAKELSHVASLVSSNSQELSAGAVEQDSVFSKLAGSVGRLRDHANSNAMLAKKANEHMRAIEDKAMTGSQEMRSLFDSMTAISENSKNIEQTLKAINTIAFQTNILALNAAVEAARAGVRGKGFSVVASEVRRLANSSAKSVVDTSGILEKANLEVAAGVDQGKKTSDTLHDIEESVAEAVSFANRVLEQATDQSAIVGEMVEGLNQVETIAKRNVDNAATNAAAAEQLLSLANRMKDSLLAASRHDSERNPAPDPSPPE